MHYFYYLFHNIPNPLFLYKIELSCNGCLYDKEVAVKFMTLKAMANTRVVQLLRYDCVSTSALCNFVISRTTHCVALVIAT